MPARLKVFRATLGFYEAVVAAASQAAALRAWGVRENLFQHGAAATTDDPLAVEPALAAPGVVLRRAVGGSGPFTAEPDLPAAPAALAPKPPLGGKRGKTAGPSSPPRPAPDRSALDAAERALADAQTEHAGAVAALDTERAGLEAALAALERRRSALEQADQAHRRTLEKAERVAQQAFVRAGGVG